MKIPRPVWDVLIRRPPGGQGNALFSDLNCRWDEGPDAWEREVRRQEVQKGDEARMEETMADGW